MSLIISNYRLLRETIESEYKITFDVFKNCDIHFILRYPSNPILDCQVVNLHEESIRVVLTKIQNLIEEDEFGIVCRIQLIQFRDWISKIMSLGNNMYI